MAIIVDDFIIGSSGENIGIGNIFVALKAIINALTRPLWVDPATSRMKADVVISSGTVTTVTTTGTLTNLGTANVTGQYIDRLSWANTIRPRIT
uniref:Uncharacterized protein n=1 Tax=candidate division CPR3 bacterium TaxID=2268181 RepID=A0A7C5UTD8_UNCC3